MLSVGRVVFAAAIVGFGVLCLSFVDFVHQLQPVDVLLPASTPGYGLLALVTGVILIAAGLAIATTIMLHQATVALAVFFTLWIVVLQVPSAFIDPSLLRSPWWVRTFETLALTGAALILAGRSSEPVREGWVRTGRILFGVSLPVFGVLHLIYAGNVASLVPAFYPWPLFWAYLTAAGNLAGGAAIVTGVYPRLAAIAVGVMYGTYAVTLHIPRQVLEQPLSDRGGWTSMFVAIGFCGAALIVAGSTGERTTDAERRAA